MTPDALWSFEFIDNKERHGAGVVVFYRNKVLGGNHGFTYIGEYSLRGDEISFRVNVKKINDEVKGIYKDEYVFVAKGKYDDLSFIITGSPDDNDEFTLAIQCTRQGEIPD
ncbi:MAG: hypothetical protein ACI9SC_002375 [Gammaproteobacteria bacterium]|jgi:hypothetical protein